MLAKALTDLISNSTTYQICVNSLAVSFGWGFAKAFHRMKLEYDLGLSRIYELVINSDPCYAFLLDSNSVLENKTVVAHVLGHSDFFKNNAMFAQTSRDMVERMAANAQRIHRYEIQYGRQRVEKLLDAGMALEQHVDASRTGLLWRQHREVESRKREAGLANVQSASNSSSPTSPYEDLWELDEAAGSLPAAAGSGLGASGSPTTKSMTAGLGASASSSSTTGSSMPPSDRSSDRTDRTKIGSKGRTPPYPERDLMWFLVQHSNILEPWERDVLSLLREEMLYFWPQLETKIMNEGWASYWHLRIMRELELPETDAVDFAKMHAGVVMPSRISINPYHIGLALWEDIEKRWNEPTQEEQERFGRKSGQGREKIFEVREMENDISFLRNYLTKDLIEKLDLYLYEKVGNEWRIVEKDWEKVRDQICAARTNGGVPLIMVKDGDFNGNGELYLKHAYESVELDIKYVEHTMPYVYQLWGRTCHLETIIEDRNVLFSYDGNRVTRKFL